MKINLIPEVKREQLKIRNLNLWMTNIAIALGVVFGAVILLMSIYIGGVSAKISSTNTQIADLETKLKAYKSLEETVISIEQGVKEVRQILDTDDKWDRVFKMFEGATPGDIRFKTMNFTPELKVTADLEGKDVKSIDRFIKSFESYQYNDKSAFSKVDVGGYTTNEKGLVTFSATFSVNSDALVKSNAQEN